MSTTTQKRRPKQKPVYNNFNKSAAERARLQRLLQVRAQERALASATVRRYRHRKQALTKEIQHRVEEQEVRKLEEEQERLRRVQDVAEQVRLLCQKNYVLVVWFGYNS